MHSKFIAVLVAIASISFFSGCSSTNSYSKDGKDSQCRSAKCPLFSHGCWFSSHKCHKATSCSKAKSCPKTKSCPTDKSCPKTKTCSKTKACPKTKVCPVGKACATPKCPMMHGKAGQSFNQTGVVVRDGRGYALRTECKDGTCLVPLKASDRATGTQLGLYAASKKKGRVVGTWDARGNTAEATAIHASSPPKKKKASPKAASEAKPAEAQPAPAAPAPAPAPVTEEKAAEEMPAAPAEAPAAAVEAPAADAAPAAAQ